MNKTYFLSFGLLAATMLACHSNNTSNAKGGAKPHLTLGATASPQAAPQEKDKVPRTLAVGVSDAHGDVSDNSAFGVKDERGAFQEVRIKQTSLTLDYFGSDESFGLQDDAETQTKYHFWVNSKPSVKNWGRNIELYFQDGELKTLNVDSSTYEQLDQNRTYAMVYATIGFDTEKQANSGVYTVSGIVTLVSGETGIGPVQVGSGKPEPGFQQSSMLGYIKSGLYAHDCNPDCIQGGQFNSFGNGKNDGGRITSVGLHSVDATPLSIGELKQAMGQAVEIVYPQQSANSQ